MKRELAEQEEKAMGQDGAGGFGGDQGGGFGGGFGGDQGGGFGGGNGSTPPSNGEGGSFAPNPEAGEFDLSQFRRVLDSDTESVKMANIRAGQRVMLPGDRWFPTPEGPVLMHNKNDHSAMVALRIPPALRSGLQEQYPFMDDDTRDNLHITLAFLGDSRTIDMELAAKAVLEFAAEVKPIKTKLQGVARFVPGGDQDAIVATIDSPDFPKFRQALCDVLDAYGVPYHQEHGFIPHMTLAYIPADDPMPLDTVEPMELNFSKVYLVDGDEWMPVNLLTSTSTTSSANGGPAEKNPFDFARMKQVLQVHHGGPGPHPSGSSQDVHGKKGVGGGSSSSQSKGGADEGDPFDVKGASDFVDNWYEDITHERSNEAYNALYYYKDGGYRYLNDVYRQPGYWEGLPDSEKDYVLDSVIPAGKVLEEYISSTTVPENLRVFRGTNLTMDKDGREKYAGLISDLTSKASDPSIDMEFSDVGFFSTSADEATAKTFGDRFGDPTFVTHSIQFKIDVPKGTHAIPVSSSSFREYEVVFAPGQRFKVTDVSMNLNRQVVPNIDEYNEYDFLVKLEAIND